MELLTELANRLGAEQVLTGADAAPYLTDWRGRYTGAARAVVRPGTTDEVAQVVRLCRRHGIAVVPQGGNTGLAGGATPDAGGGAIVLSTRRLDRLRAIDTDDDTMTVEAGCVLQSVQDWARDAGRLYPLSLASEGSCTVGGNLATNAGGTAVLRYGTARDLTLGIECVLADGSVIAQLSPLRKNNTGYDLKNLLIGSEGTLGVITAACLKLFPQPHLHATAWVGIPSPAAAVELLARLRAATGDALATLELVPEVALELVLRHVPAARHPGISDSPWHLLVEVPDTGRGDAEAALTTALQQASEVGLVTDAAIALNAAQREDFWQLRESVPEAQRRAGGSLKHDVAVPVASIPSFIEAGAQLCARMAPEGYLVAYGHAGDGNLHFNLNQREGADKAAFLAREAPLRRAVHDLVASYGGTFSAEHGIGQLKVDELRRYASPAGLAAMHRIKQALDPHHILNPGKVL